MNIIELDDRDTTVIVVDLICSAHVFDLTGLADDGLYRLVVLMSPGSGISLTHYYDDQKKRDIDFAMLKKKMKAVDLRPRRVIGQPQGFDSR